MRLAVHSASQPVCSGSPWPGEGDRQTNEGVFLTVRAQVFRKSCENAEKSGQTAGKASRRSSPKGAEESVPRWRIRTATRRYAECALDLSTVAFQGLQASPESTQENFPDPDGMPSQGTPVQVSDHRS